MKGFHLVLTEFLNRSEWVCTHSYPSSQFVVFSMLQYTCTCTHVHMYIIMLVTAKCIYSASDKAIDFVSSLLYSELRPEPEREVLFSDCG